jgi:N-acetylglucosaminyldiphosphoundecaprenol N-acetyl-beta-D-mannosaminyltransferase
METRQLNRVRLLDVPLDSIEEEQALKAVESFLLDGERHQLVFVTLRGFFKGRRDHEFRRCLREASLVLPVYPGLAGAARFLKRLPLVCYSPFSFVIRVLALVERLNRTVYLLGSHKEELERAERNLRDSFPRLRLVGRFAGYFPRAAERNVLLAIQKATPAVLLAGSGLVGGDLWLLRRKKELTGGICVWVGDCFELFSGRRRTSALPAEGTRGLLGPLRVMAFWLLVLFNRLFRR